MKINKSTLIFAKEGAVVPTLSYLSYNNSRGMLFVAKECAYIFLEMSYEFYLLFYELA